MGASFMTSTRNSQQAAYILLFLAFIVIFIIHFRNGYQNHDHKRNISPSSDSIDTQIVFKDLLMKFLSDDLSRNNGSGDIYSYANKLRLYKKLRSQRSTGAFSQSAEGLYKSLHDHLFKWALREHRFVEEYQRTFKGRGYVVCAGGKYVKLAIHAIKVIRLLGSNLPVEVFYNGEDDINPQQHEYLSKMKNVKVFDLQRIINTKELALEKWDIKPFALLACSFAEAVLIDADTVFVHNPDELFADPGYISTGTAFFYDRTLFGFIPGNATAWIDTIIPEPLSSSMIQSRFYNRKTNYEMEAGVVLVDKSRRLLGLLTTCRLNFPDFKEELHQFTHGDKESFWLGQELAAEPYYFIPTMSGSFGMVSQNDKEEKQVCGKAAHFDRNEKLFWFNDGIVQNKHVARSDPSNLQFYGIEGRWDVLCLVNEPKPIDASSKMNLHRILSSFERDPLEMGNPQDGSAMFLLGTT